MSWNTTEKSSKDAENISLKKKNPPGLFGALLLHGAGHRGTLNQLLLMAGIVYQKLQGSVGEMVRSLQAVCSQVAGCWEMKDSPFPQPVIKSSLSAGRALSLC